MDLLASATRFVVCYRGASSISTGTKVDREYFTDRQVFKWAFLVTWDRRPSETRHLHALKYRFSLSLRGNALRHRSDTAHWPRRPS
jgi:hypothetical protein